MKSLGFVFVLDLNIGVVVLKQVEIGQQWFDFVKDVYGKFLVCQDKFD